MFESAKFIDKTNHRKKSEGMAYINAFYNSGVYSKGWKDMVDMV